jgi:autotransporter-associated beta strand protein
MNKSRLFGNVIGTALTMLIAGPWQLQAADGTWKSSAGNGNWSDSSNWVGDPSPVPGGIGSSITFEPSSGGYVALILAESHTLGSLNIGGDGARDITGGKIVFDNGEGASTIVINEGTGVARFNDTDLDLTSSLVIEDNTQRGLLIQGGTITGDGGITKNGQGSLALVYFTGAYTGGFTLNEGTVIANTATGFGTGKLVLNGGKIARGEGEGNIGVGNAYDIAGDVTIDISTSGGMWLTGVGKLEGSHKLTVEGVNPLTIANTLEDGSVSSGFEKAGAGTLRITSGSVSTYTGATIISEGTLQIHDYGSINQTSGITVTGGELRHDGYTALNRAVVLNGGTLRHNSGQAYSGSLTFTSGKLAGTNWRGGLSGLVIGENQTISPGDGVGTAVTGDQTWAQGGTYEWQINDAAGVAGSNWDLLNGDGALTISAGLEGQFTIKVISLTAGGVAGDTANFDGSQSYEWLIADFASTITFDESAFRIDADAFSNSYPGGFMVVRGDTLTGPGSGDDTQLWLIYSQSIPEPSTYVFAALGVGALLFHGKRKRVA